MKNGGGVRVAVVLAIAAASAFIALTVAVTTSWGPLIGLDRAVADGANTYAAAHPDWVWAMKVWTNVAGPVVWRVLAVLVGVWLLVRRAVLSAAVTVGAVMAAWLLATAIKEVIGRARPAVPHPYANPVGMSFPSSHAATSTVAAGVLLLMALPLLGGRWRAAASALAVAVPITVGCTRVGLDVHWTSDVVGGWLLGLLIVAVSYLMLTAAGPHRLRPAGPAGQVDSAGEASR